MLIVGSEVWKMSRLLAEDVGLTSSAEEREWTNCLITEVVVPEFKWEDHKFMTRAEAWSNSRRRGC
ncbi:hypothetical protein BDQ12DRAFT_685732 [Crucibulum laeve]|uniref:Uncharacterized protein n=1 Tax=Crucibulum laeve TaxID=68775 RepID=A0A5C3LW52_9AGAR|nr:hypothetical protein BDQ12DRAFT_685732 [Crucibulum laeve]